MREKKKFVVIIVIAGVLVLAGIGYFTWSKYKRVEVVKIGYQETSLYQHIFIAQEKGFFKDEGIQVELVPFKSGNQMMQALVTNDINILGLTNLQVALTVEEKEQDKFEMFNFLVWKENAFPDYILAKKGNGVNSLKDLEGKSIGLHPGSAVKAFAKTVFDQSGVAESKINQVELEPSLMQSSLLSDNVQAVYCLDPACTNLLATNEVNVLIANPMKMISPPPTPISGSAVSKVFMQASPDATKRIIRALDRAIDFTRDSANKNEIADIISKYTPTKKEITEKMNPSDYWKSNEINVLGVQQLSDKFAELKIVNSKIDANQIILK